MNVFNVLDVYAGQGGFSLGLEMAGASFNTVAFCEINLFCQGVLRRNWPHIPVYEDVKHITRKRLTTDGIGRIDIITAGVPCQPASIIGKRKGRNDGRWLWPDTLRIVEDFRPILFVGENPPGLLTLDGGGRFGEIIQRLSKAGYVGWWETIPATAVGAGHRRERTFLIAHSGSEGLERHAGYGEIQRPPQSNRPTKQEIIFPVRDTERWWQDKSPVPIVVNGVSDPMVWKQQTIATGNAVCPPVIKCFGRAIMEVENA